MGLPTLRCHTSTVTAQPFDSARTVVGRWGSVPADLSSRCVAFARRKPTSTRSANGSECVEVAMADVASGARASAVFLRDSKNPSGPVITLTSLQWRAFIAGVKEGSIG
ncbi:DUF397 domain-containing protein [Sphaerisporangium sp. NPDC051011]|uniref:DUF397 domain-containing protein n=1 Tax=Sphaerisporangium sp. NPDC051011 TaxID=3155792 RepID=UPI003410330D